MNDAILKRAIKYRDAIKIKFLSRLMEPDSFQEVKFWSRFAAQEAQAAVTAAAKAERERVVGGLKKLINPNDEWSTEEFDRAWNDAILKAIEIVNNL